MPKIFDPKITPGPWKSVNDFTTKFLNGRNTGFLRTKEIGDKEAIFAIPEMLEVVKAARKILKWYENSIRENIEPEITEQVTTDMASLSVNFHMLDQKHGEEV